jgi:hypothetical protein
MMKLKAGEHSVMPGRDVIEVWDGDQMVGAIYPTDTGVKILSKYLPEVARLCDPSVLLPDEITILIFLKPRTEH